MGVGKREEGGGSRREGGRRRKEEAMREVDHECVARRNNKYLGYTGEEVARPTVRRVEASGGGVGKFKLVTLQ